MRKHGPDPSAEQTEKSGKTSVTREFSDTLPFPSGKSRVSEESFSSRCQAAGKPAAEIRKQKPEIGASSDLASDFRLLISVF